MLPPDWTDQMRVDLEAALRDNPNGLNNKSHRAHLAHRMFETSAANLRLFDMEPMVSLAEAVIGTDCHVIHNNSFISPPGGGLDGWHQDDRPHYIVKDGDAPVNVHLPVLFFTANYYLTDVIEIEHGGTETIPGSHLFGASPPRQLDGTEWEERIQYNLGAPPAAWSSSTTRSGTAAAPTAVSAPATSPRSPTPGASWATSTIRS